MISCSEKQKNTESKIPSQTLYLKCEEDDICAYFNENGEEIITKGKYMMYLTDTFTTMARVLSSEKGFIGINQKEEVLFKIFPYDNFADEPSEGTFRIMNGDKLGLADMTGKIIIPTNYVGLYPMQQGRVVFCEGCSKEQDGEHFFWKGGKWGAFDKNGKIIISPIYDTNFYFDANGKAVVSKHGEKMVIDLNGNKN